MTLALRVVEARGGVRAPGKPARRDLSALQVADIGIYLAVIVDDLRWRALQLAALADRLTPPSEAAKEEGSDGNQGAGRHRAG